MEKIHQNALEREKNKKKTRFNCSRPTNDKFNQMILWDFVVVWLIKTNKLTILHNDNE